MAQYATTILLYGVVDKLFGSVYVATLADRGLSASQVGLVLAAGSVAMTVFDYPTGNLADHFGRKKIAGSGFVLWGISLLMYSMAQSIFGFMGAMVLWALGVALISGAPSSWFVDELITQGQDDRRKTVMPLVGTASLLIGAAAAGLSGWLASNGMVLPLRVGGWVAIATGVSLWLFLHENYGERQESVGKTLARNTRDLFRHPMLRLILVKSSIGSVPFHVFILAWQLYAIQALGLPPAMLGPILTGLILTLAAGNGLSAWLMRSLRPTVVSIIGLLLVTVGLVTLGAWRDPWVFAVGAILLEIGLGLDQGASDVWVHDLIPSAQRSSFISAISSAEALMGMGIPIAAGLLIQHTGFHSAWWLAAGFTAGTVVVVTTIARMTSGKEVVAHAEQVEQQSD